MDLAAIDPTGIEAAIADRGIGHAPDGDLVTAVSTVLARPRTADTSFTLHAPLELMARARLLPRVGTEHRSVARARLVALAAMYDHSGDPVDEPEGAIPATVEDARELLRDAIAAGDPDAADRAALGLARLTRPIELAPLLGDDVVPLLGAAGHTPIALTQWPLVELGPLDGAIIRHLLRNLATEGALRFRFAHPNRDRRRGSGTDLAAPLAAVPIVGPPGFGVFLAMDQAERHDALAEFPGIEAAAVPVAFRLVLRQAANAMLTDNPDHAPYGWSHALTLPLALAQLAPHLADATVALDAALTHWCGFRMSHGQGPIVPADPGAVSLSPGEALAVSPQHAAGAARHSDRPDEVAQVLIDNAATSHDAHLVKYTVAVLDAGTIDPSHRPHYLAAAAFLAGWWRQHPPADDPLPGSDRR